jgi:hypothetical protein
LRECRSAARAAFSLFADFTNAIFQPFAFFAVGGLNPVPHFVFSVPKALAVLPAFAIVSPLVTALLWRWLANSRQSRNRDLDIGLSRSLGIYRRLRDDVREQ